MISRRPTCCSTSARASLATSTFHKSTQVVQLQISRIWMTTWMISRNSAASCDSKFNTELGDSRANNKKTEVLFTSLCCQQEAKNFKLNSDVKAYISVSPGHSDLQYFRKQRSAVLNNVKIKQQHYFLECDPTIQPVWISRPVHG